MDVSKQQAAASRKHDAAPQTSCTTSTRPPPATTLPAGDLIDAKDATRNKASPCSAASTSQSNRACNSTSSNFSSRTSSSSKSSSSVASSIDFVSCSCNLTLVLEDSSIYQEPWCISTELADACRTGDVLLVCAGNTAVQCHSQILAICTRVLREMLESIDFCSRCSGRDPIKFPMPGDVAEHWLFALWFMYPTISQPPVPNLSNAMTLAELGHKYDIPKAMAVWEEFVSGLVVMNPSVGHHKWVLHDWGSKKEDKSFCSETFTAAGHKWRLKMYPQGCGKAANASHMSLYLFARGDTDEEVNVDFQLVVVRQGQPSNSCILNLSHVFSNLSRSCGEHKFMHLAQLEDPQEGFILNDALEVRVVVKSQSQQDERREDGKQVMRLSSDPEDAGYVFTWWEAAKRLKDEKLESKCLSFMGKYAFHAVLNKQFGEQLLDAVARLEPPNRFKLLLDMRDNF